MRSIRGLDVAGGDGIHLLTDGRARERGVLVAFTDRAGGVSRPPYDSLNLAARVGDDRAHVDENRRRVGAAAGFRVDELCLARQVHAAGAIEARRGDAGVLGEADVLLTREPGVALGILTADCAPVVVAGQHGVAIAHAGWRGLVAGVVEVAIEAVGPVEAAWVGPCIRACCYEVGPEVIQAFAARGLPVGDDRVDPMDAAVAALRAEGIDEIAAAGVCTSCDRSYFSYRRDGVTGRQGAFAALLVR